MTFSEWLWRLISNFGLIIRRGHSHGRFPVLAAYLRIELKRFFLVKLLGRKMTSESIFGYRIHFFNYETFATLFEEVYIPDVYYFSSLSPEPFVIDCGSNIGMAVLYFKRLYPNCSITAFEADDATFKILERNVSTNGLENVALVNKALYDSKGTVTFYVSPNQPGQLVQSTRKESLVTSVAKVVESEVLSDYITRDVDFLKMDIEGAEDRVMNNLFENRKLSFIKEMVIEYHHHMTHDEDKLGAFLSVMEQSNIGYQIKAPLVPPFQRGEFQGLLVYAYRLNGSTDIIS
jgi:FkbM family methyltransferase